MVQSPYRTASAHCTGALSREKGHIAIRVCHVEPHRGLASHTADSVPPIAPSLHRMEEKAPEGYLMRSYAYIPAKIGFANVGTTVRRRKILLQGFLARMGSKRLPK